MPQENQADSVQDLATLAGSSAEEEAQESASVSDENETAEASDTSDKNEDEGEKELEASEDDESEDGDEEEQKPKKRSGWQRRINKMRRQLSEKERELEFYRQMALKQKGDDTPQKPAVEAPERPKRDDFETQEEYLEAVADWKVEQKLKDKEAKEQETKIRGEYDQKKAEFAKKCEEFRKARNDFDDVLEAADEAGVRYSPILERCLLESDRGPAVLYELAKDPDEFERLNKLPYGALNRELGRIEARLEREAQSSKNEVKKITKAPPPVKPVKNGAAKPRRSLDDPNLSLREFEELYAEKYGL